MRCNTMLTPTAKPESDAPSPPSFWRWQAMPSGWDALPTDATPAMCRPGLELMRELPLLRELGDGDAAWLARRATIRPLRRGALLLEQGSQEQALYIVLSGCLHAVRRGPRGRLLIADVLHAGDHYGELGLVDDQPHAAALRCMAAGAVVVVRQPDFHRCLAACPAMREALMRTLAQRLRQRNRRISLLALNDVRGCVIGQLLEQSEAEGALRIVRQPVNRQTLADIIGASREMVSRIVTELAHDGLIELRADGSTLIHAAAPQPV
jgi:CRP/FNR family cyclic AMP-dependent transcriptional regulator